MDLKPVALLAPVSTSCPPGKRLASTVLPLSRDRAGATIFRSSALSSISGSMRCCELRLASSTVGCTARIGPGAWWMMNPMKLFPASVAPVCAAFMNTTRSMGLEGDRLSMISRM